MGHSSSPSGCSSGLDVSGLILFAGAQFSVAKMGGKAKLV